MWRDIAFLAVAGFLLGVLAYIGWYSTREEPETEWGWTIVGIGVLAVIVHNIWLEFRVDRTNWFLTGEFIGFSIIDAGLVLILRARRKKDR